MHVQTRKSRRLGAKAGHRKSRTGTDEALWSSLAATPMQESLLSHTSQAASPKGGATAVDLASGGQLLLQTCGRQHLDILLNNVWPWGKDSRLEAAIFFMDAIPNSIIGG